MEVLTFVLDFRISDKFSFMTGLAVYSSMGPLQVITGQRMIKLISIETDHLKIPAMMITVAFNTLFSFDLQQKHGIPCFQKS